MKILIEEFPYPADTIRPYIAGLDPLTRDKKTIRINYVGYCYNHTVKDCVFFLPKVVLNGGSEGYSYNSVFNSINAQKPDTDSRAIQFHLRIICMDIPGDQCISQK